MRRALTLTLVLALLGPAAARADAEAELVAARDAAQARMDLAFDALQAAIDELWKGTKVLAEPWLAAYEKRNVEVGLNEAVEVIGQDGRARRGRHRS